MLDLIDEGLEAFFRATVPLDAADVDVSFEPPEREWSAKLSRPTVNAFLWDIRRSSQRARTGVETIERDGKTVRRMALPVVELRYLVTAWTSDHGDERALLGGLMRTILAHDEIPLDYLPDALGDGTAPSIVMARSGEEQIDVFKTLEGQLKPGINMVVVGPVDVGVVTPAGPPTESVAFSVSDQRGTARSSVRRVAGQVVDPDAVGAKVLGPGGAAVVNPAGQFLINAAPGDQIVIETDPPTTVTVPERGGIRVE